MPKDNVLHVRKHESSDDQSREEAQGLLSTSSNDEDADLVVCPPPVSPRIPLSPQRQSSLSHAAANGSPRTPRTSNRVRFDIEERRSREHAANGHPRSADSEEVEWMEEEDYLSQITAGNGGLRTGQRAPLLTDIEAPSITVASSDLGFNAEDLLESARPKSGMGSAFMNMANSIM